MTTSILDSAAESSGAIPWIFSDELTDFVEQLFEVGEMLGFSRPLMISKLRVYGAEATYHALVFVANEQADNATIH